MAAPRKVRAIRRFVVITDNRYRVVQADELFSPADEVVKASPAHFESVEAAKDREKRGAS